MYYILTFGLLISGFLAASWFWLAHKVTIKGDLRKVRPPLIVFDFDGTICPSYPLFIEQVNFLADRYNLRKIEPCEVEDFRNMSPKTIIKTLGVSMFQLPFMLREARRNVQDKLLELQPVPGILEVLREIKLSGCSLGILTSNSAENVLSYLQKYKIDLFDFIYAGNNIFGKDKHLKRIRKKARLATSRIVYVGDEIRDMEAARKAQWVSVAVTWGYNSTTLLQESHPDFLSQAPSELLSQCLINN